MKPLTKSSAIKANMPIYGLSILLFSVTLLGYGCKSKLPVEKEEYYGYGKLSVYCEKKCHVKYGEPGKMNEYDVEADTAAYYFRYQSKYNIDIDITPSDETQKLELWVRSREDKSIFHNSVNAQPVNVSWNTKILVP